MTTSDPYDLLRRAKELLMLNPHRGTHEQWLKDFQQLPGAKLSQKAVRLLRNPHRKHVPNTADDIERLLKQGFLMEVSCIGGPESRWTQTRVSPKGRKALHLREDVKP